MQGEPKADKERQRIKDGSLRKVKKKKKERERKRKSAKQERKSISNKSKKRKKERKKEKKNYLYVCDRLGGKINKGRLRWTEMTWKKRKRMRTD